MKNKKETRTCIGCRKKDNKHNLIRLTNLKNRKVVVDIRQKENGRGTYLCKNEDCLIKAMKNKSLKLNFNDEEIRWLRGVILGG